jgi:hypothetical protein
MGSSEELEDRATQHQGEIMLLLFDEAWHEVFRAIGANRREV